MPRTCPWELSYAPLRLLETSDVFILWNIGSEGPLSISEIANKIVKFPNPERVVCLNEQIKSQIIGKKYTLDKSTTFDSIKRLSKTNLVYPINISSERMIYALTFNGLIIYLYHFWSQGAFSSLRMVYQKLKLKPISKTQFSKLQAIEKILPPLPLWKDLTTEYQESAVKALEQTVIDVYHYDTVPRIHNLMDHPIQIYSYDFDVIAFYPELISKNDACNLPYLKLSKFPLLFETFIANKIRIHEFGFEKTFMCQLQDLKDFSSYSFSDLLKFLFPKYNAIEYFFTGLFAQNLLLNALKGN
jgi:hypothetical protein